MVSRRYWPAERFHDGDTEGADAALRVADKAKLGGSNEEAVLDALEAAETAYDSAHPGENAASGTCLSSAAIPSTMPNTSCPSLCIQAEECMRPDPDV